jgi:hypothetical protein
MFAIASEGTALLLRAAASRCRTVWRQSDFDSVIFFGIAISYNGHHGLRQ